jgi:hypothetical protein
MSDKYIVLFSSIVVYGFSKLLRWLQNVHREDQISDAPHVTPEQVLKADIKNFNSKEVVVTGRTTTVDLNRLYFYKYTNLIFQLTSMKSNTRCQITCENLPSGFVKGSRIGFADRYNFLLEYLLNTRFTKSILQRKYIFNDDLISVLGEMRRNPVTGENYIVAKLINQGNAENMNFQFLVDHKSFESIEKYSKLAAGYSLVSIALEKIISLFTTPIKDKQKTLNTLKSLVCGNCHVNPVNVALNCHHFFLCSSCYENTLRCKLCESNSNSEPLKAYIISN